jgi:hypothetical protein
MPTVWKNDGRNPGKEVKGETKTCPQCEGLGEIPPPHTIVENETSLALHYWECTCELKSMR